MLDVAQNVLPVFLMIFIGWLIVATRYLKPEAGIALSEFVFKLAVPVLIFRTLAQADFHGAFPVRLWIAYFSGVAVTWTVGHVIASRLFRTDQRTATVTGVPKLVADQLSAIAGPAALVSLGMAMRRYGAGGNIRMASAATVLKLFLLPFCVMVFSHLLGLSREWQTALVLTAAVPTGVNAWLIAAQFCRAESLAATTITMTTAIGVASVIFWAWMMG